jgi:threonine dehydrogenase-like Zn-dependent dehydrogenase
LSFKRIAMPYAAVMPGPDQPIELRDYASPKMEPGAVLLETLFSEVCGTDVHLQRGRLAGVPYPIIPGHVSVGRVIQVQGDVRDVLHTSVCEGDLVTFLDVHETCNHCWYCLVAKQSTRCPHRRVYGITYSGERELLGGWSEQIYLKPGVKIIKLPASVPPSRLIAGGCALPTSIHAMDRAEIRLGDTVAIQGAGPVGLNLALLARLSGAGRVIVVDRFPNRLEMATKMGADQVVQIDPSSPRGDITAVQQATSGRGADITMEATGSPSAVPAGMQMTRDGGRYVIVGHYTDGGEIPINPHQQINRKHLEIRGCWGSDFSHFFRMVQILDHFGHRVGDAWDALVNEVYSLHGLNEALQAVASGRVVKAIVEPNQKRK